MPVETPGDERSNERPYERSNERFGRRKGFHKGSRMRTRSGREIPDALRRHNEEQRRDPEDVVSDLGWRVRVVVLWRQSDDDPERWIYLERMLPGEFSYETVKQRW